MNEDLKHLGWLSTGFYVYAGITALFSSFFLLHVGMGIAMVADVFPNDGKASPPPFFGWFFVAFGAAFVITGWATAVVFFFAARYLKKTTKHTFCLVAAGIACAFAPLGTVLGVFTIVVLLRDSVKALFNGNLSAAQTNQSFDPPDWRQV